MIAGCVLCIAVALHFRGAPADTPAASSAKSEETQRTIIHTNDKEAS
ncbi:hypothetical protein [Marinobacter shengliensis]|nr:hypothetical protein [Marinobacter shengliensis]